MEDSMWSLCLSFMVLLFISVNVWIHRWRNPKCKGKLPPGSMGLPLIGETLNFFVTAKSIDIHPFIKERMQRYGPLFKTSLAGRPAVISSDPDFNHFVLQQEGKLVELYYMDAFDKLLLPDKVDAGSFMHKYIRRLILNHFGSDTLKTELLSRIEDSMNHTLHEWAKLPEVDARAQIAAIMVDMGSKVLMSYEEPENSEVNLAETYSNFTDGLLRFPLYIPGTTFYKCRKKQQKVLKIINELVEERSKSNSEGANNNRKGDVLDQLMEDMGEDGFLTKEFATRFTFAMFLAMETVAPILIVTIKYLLENPSVVQQLTEEHVEILKKREGNSNNNPGLSWEEYKNMTFTHYVINEGSRLASVAPGIMRKVKTDIHVDGYTIPKDWILLVVPAAIHLHPNNYKDPLTFNPSRWKDIEGIAKAKNFIPFGGGNRSCVGAEFSRVVMAVFIHVWLTKYRLTKTKGGDVARTPILKFLNGFYVKVSEKTL